jgi:ubiquinone/menaquinone biosynthesis C-methylase UbiE
MLLTMSSQSAFLVAPARDRDDSVAPSPTTSDRPAVANIFGGLRRRLRREQRRRQVGRAYDMALEIARLIPGGSKVLDVGCGNGFIAHHLSAMLGTAVIGIDVMASTAAPIDYRPYDGRHFPVSNDSVDAILLCYVLHHTQDIQMMLSEIRRVLRRGGVAIIYEDIPRTSWDQGLCRLHDRKWRRLTGPCSFRNTSEWRALFDSFGFEIVSRRWLSRWRNLTHPVTRFSFVLRRRSQWT